MAQQQLYRHDLPNGMTLLAERMDHVRSASMYLLVPSGFTYDPPDKLGTAAVLAEMLVRGAGTRDSKQLALALDNLGTDRSESVGPFNVVLSAGTLARNLPAALALYADVLRRPHLPEDEVDAVKALALQDLLGLEDEPAQKLFIELRSRHYPPPLGQDARGTPEGIDSLTPAILRGHFRRLVRPRGTILSVAGNIDWEALVDQVGRLLGDWKGGEEPVLTLGQPRDGRVRRPGVDVDQDGLGAGEVLLEAVADRVQDGRHRGAVVVRQDRDRQLRRRQPPELPVDVGRERRADGDFGHRVR